MNVTEVTQSVRPANAGRAHYRGDRRSAIGQLMGPNLLGELLVVVDATYDLESDRTTLGFDYARRWTR